MQTGVEGQSLTAKDHLFILMQAAAYLTVARGVGAPEARICYERAESLCHSLNRPLLLYVALIGQWRYSLHKDKLTATMQIAKRIYSLAQEQDDPALMIGGCQAWVSTLFFLGDFESARQHAVRGVEIWHSGSIQSPVEQVDPPAVVCLCYKALIEWLFGEIASCQSAIAEAISLAKELNDTHATAEALFFAAALGQFERNPAEVERLASELIELSVHYNFAHWLPLANILRGWARSASGSTAEGLSSIEDGIDEVRATGPISWMSYFLALKAEALHFADRASEALQAITEAEAFVESTGGRYISAELDRLRAVFLAAIGADDIQIETSFRAAISTAKQQKSISLATRGEATYAEYRRQKPSGLKGQGLRLPIN